MSLLNFIKEGGERTLTVNQSKPEREIVFPLSQKLTSLGGYLSRSN